MSVEQRFGGIRRLYGIPAYDAFSKAHISVVGIGGVGSWAAEALARSGIGQITLIDMDDVCVTNTNRQLHALDNTIGRSKVDVMAERIRAINPDCQVHAVEDFITSENVAELLNHQFDYVIDAIDSLKPKAAMVAWCRRNKVKIITTGGAGGQIDPTKILISDLSRTERDPLAAKLRNFLRRYYNFPKNTKRRFEIECVYSTEQLRYQQEDGSISLQRPEWGANTQLGCDAGFGSSTVVTATFGFVAAGRVLEKLAKAADKEII